MDQNFDDIHNTYEDLAAGDGSSWEIYSGEEFRTKAEEKGIPEDKWSHDRMEMQFGQEAVAEELSQGIPQSPEERESRLRAFISRQISNRLNQETDDVARRGMLLQAIQAGREVTESELAALSQRNLSELREELIDLTIAYTKSTVLPAMERQCELLLLEPEQKEKIMNNPAALVAACYLEVPQLREMPTILGAEAEVIEQYAANAGTDLQENVAKILDDIAYALLLVASLIAFWALLLTIAPAAGAFVVRVLYEGEAIAKVGALILPLIPDMLVFFLSLLKWSAAAAALSAVTRFLSHMLSNHSEEQAPETETGSRTHTVPMNT